MINMIYGILAALAITGTLGEYTPGIEGERTVNEGDVVTITCSLVEENAGDDFEWFRFNADDSHTTLGVRSRLSHDYLKNRDSGAFTIEKIDNSEYKMVINGAQVEDNALYGCGTQIDKNNTVQLIVRHAPESILMFGANRSLTLEDTLEMEPYVDDMILHVEDGAAGHFLCVADGFIPEPTLTMTFDGKVLENVVLAVNKSIVVSDGDDDLHYEVITKTVRTDTTLTMTENANRLELACEASLPGTDVVVRTAFRPILNLAPRIVCKDEHVPSEMRNFKLSCLIEADPAPSYMMWQWEDHLNQTINMTAGESISKKFSSCVEDQVDGRIKVSMEFDRVTPQVFNTYNLYVENDIGSAWGNVTITRDRDSEDNGASSVFYSLGCLLLSVLIAMRQL